MNYEEFIKEVKKVSGHRVHKVKSCLGSYDAFKYIRKNKWFNIGRPLKENEFYSIIRLTNKYISDALFDGKVITLPHRMGQLSILITYPSLVKADGTFNTVLMWGKTLKLWHEDEEAYKDKTLVKETQEERYRLVYNKEKAKFINHSFYHFHFNRSNNMRLYEASQGKYPNIISTCTTSSI